MGVQCLQRLEEHIGSPGMGVTDSWDLPYGCQELNPNPLGEQSVLSTSETSLQPCGIIHTITTFKKEQQTKMKKLQCSKAQHDGLFA